MEDAVLPRSFPDRCGASAWLNRESLDFEPEVVGGTHTRGKRTVTDVEDVQGEEGRSGAHGHGAEAFGNNPTERIEHGPIDHMRGRETHVAEGFQIGGAVAEVEIPVGEHERPVGKTLEETVEGDSPPEPTRQGAGRSTGHG